MKYFRYILTAMALVLTTAWCVETEAKEVEEVDIYDLSLDDNLLTPVPENEKVTANLRKFQDDFSRMLEQNYKNFKVETMRDGEVIVFTVPASNLFASNEMELSKEAEVILEPLLRFIEVPGMFKMMLVMHHCGNLGNDQYALDITTGRVNSVFDWIESHGSVDYVVPYALGNTDASVDDDGNKIDNDSAENRKINRRLEIYLVPEQGLLDLCRKGRPKENDVLRKSKKK